MSDSAAESTADFNKGILKSPVAGCTAPDFWFNPRAVMGIYTRGSWGLGDHCDRQKRFPDRAECREDVGRWEFSPKRSLTPNDNEKHFDM